MDSGRRAHTDFRAAERFPGECERVGREGCGVSRGSQTLTFIWRWPGICPASDRKAACRKAGCGRRRSASLANMQRLSLLALPFLLLTGMRFSDPAGSDARAQELIRELRLQVLPRESGYLGIIGHSAQTVTVGGRSLAVQSQN